MTPQVFRHLIDDANLKPNTQSIPHHISLKLIPNNLSSSISAFPSKFLILLHSLQHCLHVGLMSYLWKHVGRWLQLDPQWTLACGIVDAG